LNDPSLLQTDLLLPALVVLSLVLQLRARVRLRSPFINWKRVLAAVVVGLVAALPSTARPVAMAQTVPVTSVDVSLTDAGLQPPSVTPASGGSIHWTNSSSQTQAIVADDGLFDSGNLLPGAGFSIALAIAGTHTYHAGTSVGSIVVAAPATLLAGAPTDSATSHIPNQAFPLASQQEFSTHPTLGLTMSRTRILVTLSPSATVSQVNAALSAANVSVIGGLPPRPR